jgi:hypothetical protein
MRICCVCVNVFCEIFLIFVTNQCGDYGLR